MTFAARTTLRVMALSFGLGTISSWHSAPIAAGMMLMLTIICFVVLVGTRVVEVMAPAPRAVDPPKAPERTNTLR